MLIVDYNQLVIANLMQQIKSYDIDENLIRHMVLNSLRSYLREFRQQYGEVVIACDSKKSWRKDFFPFYKGNRKKAREESKVDWKLVFGTLDKIRNELKENFPYKVLEIEGLEADDIIGILVKEYHNREPILIISSDKDFVQLQKYPNVTQYSPILKKFISTQEPQKYIREHIMRGDKGDGIPNFMSADNTFALGERQKRLSQKKLDQWVTMEPEEFCNESMLRGYRRNETIICLDKIPEVWHTKVLEEYNNCRVQKSKSQLLNYFIEKRLKNLLTNLDEF